MAVQLLACPLCSQPGFTTLDSLREGLISAASRQLICPVCHDVLSGLDKFTIHLFSHCIQNNVRCLSLSGTDQAYNPTGRENVKSYPRPVCTTKPLINQVLRDSKVFESARDACVHDDRNVEADHSSLAVVRQPTVYTIGLSDVSTCHSNENVPLDTPHVSNNRGNRSSDLPEPRGIARNEDRAFEPRAAEKTVEEETRCDRCGITFEDPKVLPLHKQLVHPPPATTEGGGVAANEKRNFGCFLCSKVFKMRGSLMVHLRVAHGASNVGGSKKSMGGSGVADERSVVCNACGKTFTKEQHLNQHMKTHEEKQWACDVCQKMFTTKYFLKKHKRLHTGEMPYSCSICHKAFTFQQSMHKHALYHSNDKPHSCPDCHRTFKELSTLANHRRIHTGEKPFSCETCGKCFRQRVSYLVHRRIHTGVMPYQCTACGKSFRYKVSERSHKCPSQPPGVIIRQAGDLLQKLQEKAAAAAQGSTGDQHQQRSAQVSSVSTSQCHVGSDPQTSGNSLSCLGLLQRQSNSLPTNEAHLLDDTTRQQLETAGTSQFIIIVDNLRPSGNVVVDVSSQTGPVGSVPLPGVWCRQSDLTAKEAPFPLSKVHPWSDASFADEVSEVDREGKAKRSDDLLEQTPDFFAVLEDLPSPSERLRNLTISPSLGGGARAGGGGTDESGRSSDDTSPHPLQTINEESLKQLLLGFRD